LLRSGCPRRARRSSERGQIEPAQPPRGEERAIVTPIPGTTRDALRERYTSTAWAVCAGRYGRLALVAGRVEQLGMARTRYELERADVVLAVHDASVDSPVLEAIAPGVARIDVYNKVDLRPASCRHHGPSLSRPKTGAGLGELRQAILRAAGWSATGESVFLAASGTSARWVRRESISPAPPPSRGVGSFRRGAALGARTALRHHRRVHGG